MFTSTSTSTPTSTLNPLLRLSLAPIILSRPILSSQRTRRRRRRPQPSPAPEKRSPCLSCILPVSISLVIMSPRDRKSSKPPKRIARKARGIGNQTRRNGTNKHVRPISTPPLLVMSFDGRHRAGCPPPRFSTHRPRPWLSPDRSPSRLFRYCRYQLSWWCTQKLCLVQAVQQVFRSSPCLYLYLCLCLCLCLYFCLCLYLYLCLCCP